MWLQFPYWKNVHGISELEYFLNLYRIEAFDCFKENVKNGRLFFRHPDEWLKGNDELDSILLRLKVILPDGDEVGQGYYKDTFCQCWSREDSKRMWEEYAKDYGKGYIKMVSKLDSLMRAFDDADTFKEYSSSFWAGRVNYSDFDENNSPIHLTIQHE